MKSPIYIQEFKTFQYAYQESHLDAFNHKELLYNHWRQENINVSVHNYAYQALHSFQPWFVNSLSSFKFELKFQFDQLVKGFRQAHLSMILKIPNKKFGSSFLVPPVTCVMRKRD